MIEDENIPQEEELGIEEEGAEISGEASGKYDALLGDNSRKYKLSGMFKDWFLDYSSYVILQRAVPHIVDGLKPVQRRVLHAMKVNDENSLTKAAKVVGQVMAYHPHGDASIFGALVQLGQKDLLIDTQGNWGNIITGDANAAGRYIECKLSAFAKEVVFNPKTTTWMRSYDGKADEPVELPVKFPLLLAQGAEGIAVGLASKILPHNFNELIDASIAALKGEDFEIYPDFPTGGFADCSKYNKGRRGGVVKVRAKIEKIDKNTIAIKEVPFSKTTHMLCDSIMKAKEKGKIKIRKIDDLTTREANIIIHLPNDVSPDKTIDALYAFTDCEVSISPNTCVIVDHKPEFLGVDDVLRYSANHTKELLGWELRIRLDELSAEWHNTSLERIFFEEKVYKLLESESDKTWEAQLDNVFSKMKEYQSQVRKEIVMDDILKLVSLPVKKISKFDVKAVEDKIRAIETEMKEVQNNLDHLTEFTISYFKNIKKKYGKPYVRRTEIASFETIAATKVISNNAKLYANLEEGFVGMNLKKDDSGVFVCDCSDLSEIIVICKDGKYKVTKISDKAFFWKDLLYVGVFDRNDKRTIYNVIYRDGKGGISYAKRFNITSVTRDKEYDITQGTEGSLITWFTANHNGEAETVRLRYRLKGKIKKLVDEYDFSQLAIKGRASRGNVVSKNPIQSIQLKSKGVSTIGGKAIWFDEDIQKLNEDGHGLLLGEFVEGDHILAIFKDGTYYTTGFDLNVKYQGEILKIEKLDLNKTYTVLYYDNTPGVKSFYVKRFSFDVNDNNPVSFISDSKGSYLVEMNSDKHPQFEVTLGGKWAHKEPERVDAEEYIAKKGIGAKGKKVTALEATAVRFIEPIVKPEDLEEEEDENVPEELTADLGEEIDNINRTPAISAAELLASKATENPEKGSGDDVVEINFDDDDEPTLF